jgi:hypothetical protein
MKLAPFVRQAFLPDLFADVPRRWHKPVRLDSLTYITRVAERQLILEARLHP